MQRITNKIIKYSQKSQTPLRLNLLYYWCKNINREKIIKQSKFMHKEIQIRLAHRIQELEALPLELRNINKIQDVIELYKNSFEKLLILNPPINNEDCDKLNQTFSEIVKNHSVVPIDISEGIQTWKSYYPDSKFNINILLDHFYLSRIGIRTLIEQHISIIENGEGIISKCFPQIVVNDAIREVKSISSYNYVSIPQINIINPNDFSFTYIKSHLSYIIVELLKNSVRATVEENRQGQLPDINIYISIGKKDLIIKISDKGSGFSRNIIDKIYNYTYTTASLDDNDRHKTQISPIAGYGHGVPLSRLYCRYFNGDLQLIPFEGIGTDALVYINKLGVETEKLV